MDAVKRQPHHDPEQGRKRRAQRLRGGWKWMKDRVQYDMECHWLLCHSLKGEEVAVIGHRTGMAG